jgi:hypothetical protein
MIKRSFYDFIVIEQTIGVSVKNQHQTVPGLARIPVGYLRFALPVREMQFAEFSPTFTV